MTSALLAPDCSQFVGLPTIMSLKCNKLCPFTNANPVLSILYTVYTTHTTLSE